MSGKMSRVKSEKWREKVSTLALTKKGRFVWNFISNLPTCLEQVLDSPKQLIAINFWKKSWSDQNKSQLGLKHFIIPNIIPDTFHCSDSVSIGHGLEQYCQRGATVAASESLLSLLMIGPKNNTISKFTIQTSAGLITFFL